MHKKAYPTGFADAYISPPADINKWLKTMNDIYVRQNKIDEDFEQSFSALTANWDPVEKREFRNWMAFYQSGAHKAYKIAQYQNNIPANLLKGNIKPDMNNFPVAQQLDQGLEIDKKIKAIVGRLAAAERIATDPLVQKELQTRLGIGISKWLEELHNLKRQVQLAPLKSIKSSLLEDIIIRHSNKLKKDGFIKAASEIASFAQMQVPEAPEQNPAPTPLTPLPNFTADKGKTQDVKPTENKGEPLPTLPNENKPSAKPDDGEGAIEALIEGMNAEDDNMVVDIEDDPISKMRIMAQEAPATLTSPELSPQAEPVLPIADDIDIFDQALSNININDVIKKFEAIANVLRTREIPRQISQGDLMLDRLGILSFFPSLGEALSKTLESNQYALTRIEDILSKLRGAVATPKENEIELNNEQVPPEMMAMRHRLQDEDNLEKARKEKRKQDDLQKTLGPPVQTPITNVEEGLNQPVALPPPPK